MNHRGTKIIETERLILRRFYEKDAEPMFCNWASDPEVTKFLTWPAHESVEVSRQVVKSWVNDKDDPRSYQWAIELKKIHEPIGSISAVKIDERTESATIGYCIGRNWWGQGIMAEALQAVIAFFFSEVNMNCVNACHDPRNPNSGKVMKKCGMVYEGTRRAGGVNNQGVCDESWYSILKKEYSADKENLAWKEIRMEHIIQDQWIDFRRSVYQFPDGSVFEPFYSYSRKDYVVIVASDEDGQYLCVRQFRQGIKEVTTEFPAGGIERTDGREYGAGNSLSASEDALNAAKRELLEETGYVSDEWKYLLTVPSNATMADNYAHIYAAANCRRSGGQNLDETEFLNVRNYSAEEIEDMINKGGFQQAIHIMAWLLMQRR